MQNTNPMLVALCTQPGGEFHLMRLLEGFPATVWVARNAEETEELVNALGASGAVVAGELDVDLSPLSRIARSLRRPVLSLGDEGRQPSFLHFGATGSMLREPVDWDDARRMLKQ